MTKGGPENDEKETLKSALKEWMDEKMVELGKFSLKTIAVLILGALVYFVLTMNGWHK
jgi:hypothetical protein